MKEMKKTLKRILIVLGVIALLIVVLMTTFSIRMKENIKQMKAVETGIIAENVLVIKDDFSNVFLIKDSNEYIAIDAGNKIETVKNELSKLEINPNQVKAVLLTHSDADHVAGLGLFKNAKVYLSKEEEQMINGETARMLIFKNKIASKKYELINDLQEFHIGNIKIKGILTPGHTPGAMCYVINDKYLFTGDLLSIKSGEISGFNEIFNMDTETSLKSVSRITNLTGIEYICTAHYGYTDNYTFAVKNWSNN